MSFDALAPSTTFRAFVIRGKEDGVFSELPLREPASDEIRVKVAYVGICGSDLHYFFDGVNGGFVIKEPLIPGHEVSGVVDLDPKKELPSGSAVVIFPAQGGESIEGLEERPYLWRGVRYLGSAATTPHTQGAMAEYIYVKRSMIRAIPSGVSLKSGALAEPLSVAIHGVRLAGGIKGKRVLISGVGPIGLLTIVAARAEGAAHLTVTDLFDEALLRAKTMGADELINTSDNSLTADSFDVIFECSGSTKAVNASINAVQRGGVIVQVGMIGSGAHPIDIGLVVTKEIKFIGAFRFNDEMNDALLLLASQPELISCITHEFHLDEALAAFEVARDARSSGKVVVAL